MDSTTPDNPSPGAAPRRRGHTTRRSVVLVFAVLVGSPLVALGVPNTVRIPIVHDHGAGNPPDAARFSHWGHGSYTCSSCHPSTFPQRKLGFTHADMDAGRYCGSCHDGRTAFAPKGKGVECETCHVPTSKKEIDENDLWGSRDSGLGLDLLAPRAVLPPAHPSTLGEHFDSEGSR